MGLESVRLSVGEAQCLMRDNALEFVLRSYRFPVECPGPTRQQEKALLAISRDGAHLSIRSGHRTGKTAFLSWLIQWWLLTRKPCKVICTAPTGHQLEDNLWGELHLWKDRMPKKMRDLLVIKKSEICVKGRELICFGVARTARVENPEALQGGHSLNLLILCDEASGIPDVIFQTAEGSLAGRGVKVVLTGNPTRTSGYFYDTHHDSRGGWETLVFNSIDSPLVDPDFVEKMKKKYGEDSDWFRVRVKGDFPKGSPDTLIPLEWIENAVGRDVVYDGSKRVAGLDVARYGDDSTALVIREGQRVSYIDQWYKSDLMNTCGKVKMLYNDRKFDLVQVDSIGMGAGVVDRLTELGVPCVGINVAEGSAYNDKFNRLRDELWWNAREFFEKQNCRLERCSATYPEYFNDFIAQLSGMNYTLTSAGKIKAKSKDEIKKDGKASPNIADAFCLSLANGFHGNALRRGARPVLVGSSTWWS